MPQFDPAVFAPQLIWLAIFFVALYVLMARLALPRVDQVLAVRRERIEGNLAKAEIFKEEAGRVLAAYQKAIVPSLNEAGIAAEIEVVRDLAVTPDTKKNGLGSFDPASFQANLDFVVKYIGVTGAAPKAEDLYATGFLPPQPVIP